MNVIFNAFVVIIVVHFLLKKLSFNSNVTIKKHNNESIQNKIHNEIQKKVLNDKLFYDIGSLNHGNKKNSFKSTLLSDLNFNSDKEDGVTKGGNYYDSNFNVPNFESNILDVTQFYDHNDYSGNIQKNNDGVDESHSTHQSSNNDNWNYANENVMNGAPLMDNVYGTDLSNSLYSSFSPDGDNLILESCDPYSAKNMNDDIRFGKGLPNREFMSQR